MAKKGQRGGRDAEGKFRKGCAPGPGNPHLQALHRFQTAIRDSQTPEHLVRVLDEMRRVATGDTDPELPLPSWTDRVAAARVWVERVAGRPKEPPELIPEGLLDFELESAQDSLKAAQMIAKAASRGQISLDAADKLTKLLDIVDKRELVTIAERLDRIEAKEQGAA